MADYATVSNLVFATAAVVIALVVLAAAPGRACNRFFAAWLGMRGVLTGLNQVFDLMDGRVAAAALSLILWLHIAIPGFLGGLMIVHLRLARTRWATAIAVGFTALATLLTFAPALESWRIPLSSLMPLGQAAAAVMLVRTVVAPSQRAYDMDWLLAMAILSVGIIDGLLPFSLVVALGIPLAEWFSEPIRGATSIAFLVGGLVSLGAAAWLAFGTWRVEALYPRRAGVMVIGMLSILAVLLPQVATARMDPVRLGQFLAGIIRMGLPALAAYGLIKFRIFIPASQVRRGVNASLVAMVFFTVYVVAGETMEAIIGEWTGNTFVGIGAAVLLVGAIVPLERAIRQVTDGIVPSADAGDPIERRRQAYLEQLEVAWMDGRLDVKEKLMLERAREHLQISGKDAQQLEQRILQDLDVLRA